MDFASLPDPVFKSDLAEPWNILITGIGGTGVVTIGALLGMAACSSTNKSAVGSAESANAPAAACSSECSTGGACRPAFHATQEARKAGSVRTRRARRRRREGAALRGYEKRDTWASLAMGVGNVLISAMQAAGYSVEEAGDAQAHLAARQLGEVAHQGPALERLLDGFLEDIP